MMFSIFDVVVCGTDVIEEYIKEHRIYKGVFEPFLSFLVIEPLSDLSDLICIIAVLMYSMLEDNL